MNKVYVVMEDWKIDSGASGIYESVFSTFEKAYNYLLHLKENYETDYNVLENENELDETIDTENEIASIERVFDNGGDYYKIWIDEKIIDSEVL